ncbi:MAG TPA: RNA polymerase subunit sigma [Verrucomicrobiales bacterium]|nr:RNA polymerase subunit sigma [Verrucomicrobiales bacterium]
MGDVTRILDRIGENDPKAASELLPLVYQELRTLAAARLHQEKPGQTLQPTALVHEAWLRLTGGDQERLWNSRGHFFGAAAEAMRRILVENARRKGRLRHGGNLERVPLDDGSMELPAPGPDDRLIRISEALTDLEQEAPEAALVVKLRYFAGLTQDQTAEALGISPRSAQRYWSWAKARLLQRIRGADGE